MYEENKNNLWQKGIEEEIERAKTAVAESTISPENLVGYQEIYLHMILDTNIRENFRRKYRLVAGGTQDKSIGFGYIQFGGIARSSTHMFTDCVTQ